MSWTGRIVATARGIQEKRFAKKLGVPVGDFGSGVPGRASVFRKCPIAIKFLEPLLATGNYTRVFSYDGATAIKDGRKVVAYSSCDYLGLSTHPRIIEAAHQALDKYGTTISSSRLTTGTTEMHHLLEQRMAEFIGGEACLVYITGYLANLGSIVALAGEGEFIVVDQKSHNSIVNACSLARQKGARVAIYRHNDMADLETKLNKCGYSSNVLVVTDGVFSMDGDIANLPELHRLAGKYNAGLFVDDAHATGVLGANGAGTPEMFGLKGEIDLVMVTLSKVVPGIGGCIIGRKEVVDYLKVRSDPFIFSLSLPPVMVAVALTALDIIQTEPELRQKLQTNADYMKSELRRLGYEIGKAEAAIIPIFIGDDEKVNRLTQSLESAGFIVDPMVYPAVGKGEALIRLVVSAAHAPDDLARTIGVFRHAGRELGII